jgi:hypothetical protein
VFTQSQQLVKLVEVPPTSKKQLEQQIQDLHNFLPQACDLLRVKILLHIFALSIAFFAFVANFI